MYGRRPSHNFLPDSFHPGRLLQIVRRLPLYIPMYVLQRIQLCIIAILCIIIIIIITTFFFLIFHYESYIRNYLYYIIYTSFTQTLHRYIPIVYNLLVHFGTIGITPETYCTRGTYSLYTTFDVIIYNYLPTYTIAADGLR